MKEREWKLRTEADVLEAIRETAAKMLGGELTAQQAATTTKVLTRLLHEIREARE